MQLLVGPPLRLSARERAVLRVPGVGVAGSPRAVRAQVQHVCMLLSVELFNWENHKSFQQPFLFCFVSAQTKFVTTVTVARMTRTNLISVYTPIYLPRVAVSFQGRV